MRIGITGAGGFLGWHVRSRLLASPEHQVIPAFRSTFASSSAIEWFVKQSEAIVHLAGVNRGSDDEIADGNVRLAEALVAACRRAGVAPPLVYANSTQSDRKGPYGESKAAAAEALRRWCRESGAPFADVVLPHLYGEGGRPFYNSVVATFAWQLANGQRPTVNRDGIVELMHAQEAAQLLLLAAEKPAGDQRLEPGGHRLTVGELFEILEKLADEYVLKGQIPNLLDPIRLRLFNVYRYNLPSTYYPVSMSVRSDHRGSLFEVVRSLNGGQSFVSTTKPGVTRGEHFHFHKVERFVVLSGEATIRIRKLHDDSIRSYSVAGSDHAYVDIPTLHTHNITNVGRDDLLTLFWSHELFDPRSPDTIAHPVDIAL